jgi:predicted RND superfamily exporter protein
MDKYGNELTTMIKDYGLSTDELNILAYRHKIKNYGQLSTVENLIEKLKDIPNIEQEIPVKINKDISKLSQLEKRVVAQRVGIKNIRKIPKTELNSILEEKLNHENIDISQIKPEPIRTRISVRKPLLEQAKNQGYHNYHNLNIEKLKELLNKEPIKRILKSDLIEQAKNLGIEVKNSMKKSIITDLIEKHG